MEGKFIKTRSVVESPSDSGDDSDGSHEYFEEEDISEEVAPRIMIAKTPMLDSMKKMNELLVKLASTNVLPHLIQNLEIIVKDLNTVNVKDLSNLVYLRELSKLNGVSEGLSQLVQLKELSKLDLLKELSKLDKLKLLDDERINLSYVSVDAMSSKLSEVKHLIESNTTKNLTEITSKIDILMLSLKPFREASFGSKLLELPSKLTDAVNKSNTDVIKQISLVKEKISTIESKNDMITFEANINSNINDKDLIINEKIEKLTKDIGDVLNAYTKETDQNSITVGTLDNLFNSIHLQLTSIEDKLNNDELLEKLNESLLKSDKINSPLSAEAPDNSSTLIEEFNNRFSGQLIDILQKLNELEIKINVDEILVKLDESKLGTDVLLSKLDESKLNTDGILSKLDESKLNTDGIVSKLDESKLNTDGILSRLDENKLNTDGILSRLNENKLNTDGILSKLDENKLSNNEVLYKLNNIEVKLGNNESKLGTSNENLINNNEVLSKLNEVLIKFSDGGVIGIILDNLNINHKEILQELDEIYTKNSEKLATIENKVQNVAKASQIDMVFDELEENRNVTILNKLSEFGDLIIKSTDNNTNVVQELSNLIKNDETRRSSEISRLGEIISKIVEVFQNDTISGQVNSINQQLLTKEYDTQKIIQILEGIRDAPQITEDIISKVDKKLNDVIPQILIKELGDMNDRTIEKVNNSIINLSEEIINRQVPIDISNNNGEVLEKLNELINKEVPNNNIEVLERLDQLINREVPIDTSNIEVLDKLNELINKEVPNNNTEVLERLDQLINKEAPNNNNEVLDKLDQLINKEVPIDTSNNEVLDKLDQLINKEAPIDTSNNEVLDKLNELINKEVPIDTSNTEALEKLNELINKQKIINKENQIDINNSNEKVLERLDELINKQTQIPIQVNDTKILERLDQLVNNQAANVLTDGSPNDNEKILGKLDQLINHNNVLASATFDNVIPEKILGKLDQLITQQEVIIKEREISDTQGTGAPREIEKNEGVIGISKEEFDMKLRELQDTTNENFKALTMENINLKNELEKQYKKQDELINKFSSFMNGFKTWSDYIGASLHSLANPPIPVISPTPINYSGSHQQSALSNAFKSTITTPVSSNKSPVVNASIPPYIPVNKK